MSELKDLDTSNNGYLSPKILYGEEPDLNPEKDNSGEELQAIYPADIKVDKEQYSFFELKRMRDTYKKLILQPDFQRNFVWSNQQKSDLIESILMNIPLPLLYFAKDRDGKLSVVDGLQRLNTVFDFMDNKFALSNLRYLNEYKGKNFSVLGSEQQATIEKCQIMVYVIGPLTPEIVKLDIFARINKSGTPLNKQEMRNALYMGASTRLLEKLSTHEKFIRTLSQKLNNKRMFDRYVLLRFFTFFLWRNGSLYNLDQFKINTALSADFDDFLARYMQIINKMPQNHLDDLEMKFLLAMDNIWQLYEDTAFKIDKNASSFHLVLFESLSFCLAQLENIPPEKKEILRKSIEEMVNTETFTYMLEHSTRAKFRLEAHFDSIEQYIPKFKEVLCLPN